MALPARLAAYDELLDLLVAAALRELADSGNESAPVAQDAGRGGQQIDDTTDHTRRAARP